jgi:glycosyltransferase involved in cell wall biosynthesis
MAADTTARVLMTADTVGGVWTHALELARGLGERGVRVDLATMGAPPSPVQRAEVARLPRVRLHESSFRLEWMAAPWQDVRGAGDWLLRLEATLKPDVVHLNQFAFGALPFRAPTLLVGHSCVLSWWRAVYGEEAPAEWDDYRRIVRDGLAGATLVAAPTRSMLASLQELHGLRGPGVVLPNGRSARDFVPARKDPLILAAGRLWDAAKNIAALDVIAPRLPWPVLVAGPAFGPDGGVHETRSVRLLGRLSPGALAAQMARATIFAAPARYEPFGQSALEAALAGCALVLGDIASVREVWGAAALYVPPDDREALHAWLAQLIDDPARCRVCAAAARARALAFSAERMVGAYLAAYGRISSRFASATHSLERLEELACAS